MAMIAGILGAVGSVVSAMGTIAAGKAQAKAAEFEAKQLEIKAAEERAAAQREGFEAREQADLVQSTLQTRAAASGFAPTSADILDLSGDIAARSGLQTGLIRYGGEERGRGLRTQAAGRRFSGEIAEREARTAALGTIIGGAGGLFKSFAQSGFGTSRPPANYYYGSVPYG